MLPTFVIGLREGLEASLIVGVMAAFLIQRGERRALRYVALGVAIAIGLCTGIAIILRWQPDTENAPSPFGVRDDLLNLQPPYLSNAREKCPLVWPRNKGVIKEDRVVLFACGPLKRQGNQVSKSSLRHRVLVRKQPVIRIEADVRTSFHRLSENVRSQSSGKCRRNGLFEEEPHMPASPGA